MYEYNHDKGFGEHHVEEGHPSLDQRSAQWQGIERPEGGNWDIRPGEQTMADLDMSPGTRVELLEHDHDRDLHRVQWVDKHGTERITSVEPEFFDAHFTEVNE